MGGTGCLMLPKPASRMHNNQSGFREFTLPGHHVLRKNAVMGMRQKPSLFRLLSIALQLSSICIDARESADCLQGALRLMLMGSLRCRFLKSPAQQQQEHFQQQQQQQQQQFAFQDNYWDPLVSEDPQSFKYGPPFGHGFNSNGGQG